MVDNSIILTKAANDDAKLCRMICFIAFWKIGNNLWKKFLCSYQAGEHQYLKKYFHFLQRRV